MPLPGRPGLAATHVFAAEFEVHHRPVSEDGMEAECRIDRPATTPVWDDTLGRDAFPTPTLIYAGRCRFHGSPPTAGQTVADRQAALGQYTVTIPADTPLIRVNDVVTLTACTGDPNAVGVPLQVMGAARSAKTWERTLAVQMQQPTVT